MADGPLLEIDSLTFRYRRATEPAIRDLSLTMERGEVLLVAGPSGCGKSTLIRAINGLIPNSYRGELSGRVVLDGHSVAEVRLRDLAEIVSTVLQDPRKQLVGSTIAGELAFGPENLGIPRDVIRSRLDTVLDATGLRYLIDRTTDQLSGGESQQLAIAGALMLHPRLLVLDEPLANLDRSRPTAWSRWCGSWRTVGVALRRLGVADKIAIMVDLTIRFIPTLSGEFAETIDAQRVRGYDPTDRKGGPIRRLRRLAPIFVPVTVGSIAGAEDTIDAMDLRGFGVGRRTWLRHLSFDRIDLAIIGLFVLFALISTFLNVTGRTDHYLLPFLLPGE
jgi:energy-coupling factor transporter ATP-binding protein EcfA2